MPLWANCLIFFCLVNPSPLMVRVFLPLIDPLVCDSDEMDRAEETPLKLWLKQMMPAVAARPAMLSPYLTLRLIPIDNFRYLFTVLRSLAIEPMSLSFLRLISHHSFVFILLFLFESIIFVTLPIAYGNLPSPWAGLWLHLKRTKQKMDTAAGCSKSFVANLSLVD